MNQKTLGALLLAVLGSLSIAAIVVVPLPTPTLDIPPGHLPPPGECKIWFPERPPGHQPPPGSCTELASQVPLGAWLIYRASPDAVQVTAYSTGVQYLAGDVAFYNADTGRVLVEPSAHMPTPRGRSFKVPKGHLPPPGQCKVWFPERPPGHQPPPGACSELAAEVPLGAWLLYRSAATGEVFVTEYHPEIRGVVLEVRALDVER